jgi:glutamine synthetase
VRRKLPLPPRADKSFWAMSEDERAEQGARELPHSLRSALDELAATPAAKAWFGETLLDAYMMLKRSEIEALVGLDDAAICGRYAEVY